MDGNRTTNDPAERVRPATHWLSVPYRLGSEHLADRPWPALSVGDRHRSPRHYCFLIPIALTAER